LAAKHVLQKDYREAGRLANQIIDASSANPGSVTAACALYGILYFCGLLHKGCKIHKRILRAQAHAPNTLVKEASYMLGACNTFRERAEEHFENALSNGPWPTAAHAFDMVRQAAPSTCLSTSLSCSLIKMFLDEFVALHAA
jgi:hypothetical protein